MSAFIVSDKTLNRIVTFVTTYKDEFGQDLKKELKKGFGTLEPQELGEVLMKLNNDSINQRYGKTPLPKYCFSRENCSIEQAVKHLHCLMYQSCEGDCYKRKEYKALKEITQSLESTICWRICDELNCEWDAL